jgi:hypothetical protein
MKGGSMPATVRIPSMSEVPPGPRRDFVEELFNLFRPARRPSLREISDRIQKDEELPGTASRETIRRMLRGTVVPTWPTAYAVFKVLCEMAGRNPSAERWPDSSSYDSVTYLEAFENAWNEAIDADPSDPPRAGNDDPWAAAPSSAQSGYSDEPPF